MAAALAVVAFTSGTASAQFVDFQFRAVTNNDSGHVAIGEDQLSLRVSSVDANKVAFTLTNTGPGVASLTNVHFYGGQFLAPDATISWTGEDVAFSKDTALTPLPGYPTDNPVLFSATSRSIPLGVNKNRAKESLTLTFDLLSGVDFAEVIAALKTHDPVHGLVVGVQMTGFKSPGRESFVVAPEPASLTMLGMSSLAGLVYAWRRRKRAVT
jgi:hypothetical protein